MKLGRVAVEDGAQVVVEVVDDRLVEVVDAGGDDLVAVATTPQDWSERGRSWTTDAAEIRVLAPVAVPPSVRDFSAYVDHTRHVLNSFDREVPDSWFDQPIFYFSNPRAIIGPGDPVRRPESCRRLDYEAELAAVIGHTLVGPTNGDVLDAVAGFTLMNDWSARDLAAREMKHSMGPAKGKDFATTLGPWLVTRDELPGLAESGVIDVQLTVSVNGKTLTDSSAAKMTFNWRQILERAAADTELVPGDVIGGGTVGYGCLLELRTLNKQLNHERYRWLADGDRIALAGGPFGSVHNTVAAERARPGHQRITSLT